MAEEKRRGRIYRNALLAANGLSARHRPLGRLVTAASFGDGLVMLRSADGHIRRKVEPDEVAALEAVGWVRS
jgi:hypothetical protein